MDAKRYTIRKPILSGTTATTLNFFMEQNVDFAGQQELIDRKFVDVEVANSINPTFDYEVTRCKPILDNNVECDSIIYTLNILNGGTYNFDTRWSDVGFQIDDFRLNKNSFNKTFLRLDFYDNDIGTSQRLLFFNTLFPSIRPVAQPNSLISQLPQPSEIQLSFGVGNVLKNPLASSEGYFIYYFKDEITPTVPKELYMRATLFNAKTGDITAFMSSNNPTISIDELAKTNNGVTGKLYTKYLLTREVDGYYYKIDNTYSNNITNNTTEYVVDLHQISVS
jgi:hypothetical protein